MKHWAVSQERRCCCLGNLSTIQRRGAQTQQVTLSCFCAPGPQLATVERRSLCSHKASSHSKPPGVFIAPFTRSDQCWRRSGTRARCVCSAGCSSEGQSWQLGNMDNQQTLEKDRRGEWENCPKLRLCGFLFACGFLVWFGFCCSVFANK